ncbi:MAG: VCBS repeat-containing protein [Nitrospirae bacterium]|nr:VCBS repeat-containing protein [Nitrospirota bacterium]
MIVEQSNIGMSSAYTQTQQYDKTESLTVRVGRAPGSPESAAASANARPIGDSVAISEQAMNVLSLNSDATKSSDSGNEDILLSGDIKELIVKLILEKLTGKKIDLKSIKGIMGAKNIRVGQNAVPPQQSVAVSYSSSETYTENQNMTYNAAGVIKTADGKEINFSLDLSLSTEFMQQNNINLQADNGVKKQDPLVVNFSGTAAQLTSPTVAFDLNSDGQNENIHFTGAGSGFLALDSNGNGKIDNGSELFGPSTGNGFAELAHDDSDKNGWIDENDPVYNALSVWTKDTTGGDKLTSLKALGIGAINIGALSTNFAYKDETNKLQGQLKSTGIFLNESGAPGTIQQIDLTT